MGCCESTVKNYSLFDSIKVGPVSLKNRVCMAAMTRMRADYNTCVPNDLHVKYYSERAEDAGMVLTECTAISTRGNCFPGTSRRMEKSNRCSS